MIKDDNNFFLSLDRISQIDSSFPREIIGFNDNYRLEKYLAEALAFGKNAYKTIREKEAKVRSQNQINYDVYKIFLTINKMDLNSILDARCETMVKNGLLKEVGDLLKNKIINEDNFNNKSAPGVNAFGVYETIKLFITLFKQLKDKDKIIASINKNGKQLDPYFQAYKKQIYKDVWEYFSEFSAKNRQYARKQAAWFRNKEEFLWKTPKLNKKKYDLDFIVHDILGLIQSPIADFNLLVKSEENNNNRNKYADKTFTNKHMPNFNILQPIQKNEFINFLKEAFSIVEQNMQELTNLINIKDKEGKDNGKENISKDNKDDIKETINNCNN